MKKQAKLTLIACISLALILVGVSIVYFTGAGKAATGDLLDTAARRLEGEPADGMVYIEPDIAALAGELSGTVESQACAKAAFDQVNAQRTAAGLGTLSWSNGLEQASAVRAIECSQVWSHNRPDGSEYWTVNSNLVYGENLAKGFSTAGDAVNAWMNSFSHRDNILYAGFKTGAIAIHIVNGQWYWANEFGY
mgnify:CR=1 FL=1